MLNTELSGFGVISFYASRDIGKMTEICRDAAEATAAYRQAYGLVTAASEF